MNKVLRGIANRINKLCNWIAVIVELAAIVVVSYGNYLERLYCQDNYTWIITLGALMAMAGCFIQKKLPWAYIQHAINTYGDKCSKHNSQREE